MIDQPKIEVRCDAGCGDSIVLPLNNAAFAENIKRAGWLLKFDKAKI